MKRAILTGYGTLENVVLADVEQREPAPDEVVVRVAAAAVNPLDGKIVGGGFDGFFPLAFPAALGTDFAGVVTRTGALVSHLREGDRVVGRLEPVAAGAFAEHVVVPARMLAIVPDGMELDRAAALPTVAGTAWQALFEAAPLRAGERVWIRGGGTVGRIAARFAALAGAEVTGDDARELDLVVDTSGGPTAFQRLRPGGRWIGIVEPPDVAASKAAGVTAAFAFHASDAARLTVVLATCAKHGIGATIDRTYPLADVRGALDRVATKQARGKVLVVP